MAALLITVGTVLVARTWLASQRTPVAAAPAPPPKIEGVKVLVAASDIPTGTLLKANHIRWQIWPSDAMPEAYLVKPRAPEALDPIQGIMGSVVRKGIAGGEPIAKGAILKPGERGFLSAVLRPGYRAMAIQVDATSGIAGLVFPGDRIDLILTHTVKRAGVNRRASETVLTNVRVLAIDQTVDDQKGAPRVFKNATLELTPKQAEMLAVVSELGRLSLSLRSLVKDEAELQRLVNSEQPLADPDPVRGKTYTWDSEVSRLIWLPSAANQDVISVSRGNAVEQIKVPKSR
ncbi:MAG: Flp pilus assembly protein CpaB [Kiloniellaceae bacterium]